MSGERIIAWASVEGHDLTLRFDNRRSYEQFVSNVDLGVSRLQPVYDFDGMRLWVRPSAVSILSPRL